MRQATSIEKLTRVTLVNFEMPAHQYPTRESTKNVFKRRFISKKVGLELLALSYSVSIPSRDFNSHFLMILSMIAVFKIVALRFIILFVKNFARKAMKCN